MNKTTKRHWCLLQDDIDDYEYEIRKLKNEQEEYENIIMKFDIELFITNNRINRAIEYVKDLRKDEFLYPTQQDLLDILEGKDD